MKLNIRSEVRLAWPAAVLVALTACGGVDSGPATYTVGGTVSGLVGSGLVLQIYSPGYGRPVAAGMPLPINANGAFTLDASGGTFVRITYQPSSPTQRCVVNNAEFSRQAASVTNVSVVCSEFAYVANAGDTRPESGLTFSIRKRIEDFDRWPLKVLHVSCSDRQIVATRDRCNVAVFNRPWLARFL
jgi:hypothetical protein